ncbi:MFS transporter [Gordonia sinesedis]
MRIDADTAMTSSQRWTILVCSLVAAMTTTCAVSGVAYLIPAMHTRDGVALSTASVIAAIPTIGLMIAIIPWGALLDRYGERRILLLSLSITLAGTAAAAAAALASAPIAVTAIFLFLGGLGSGAANGASGRIVVGWFPPDRRGTAMGIRQMAQPLGIGVCALTMPVLAAAHGIGVALLIPVAVTGLGLLACVFGIVDPPAVDAGSGTDVATSEATPQVWNPYRASRFLHRIHGVSVLLVIPQSMLWTFVPTWLIVAHQWSPASAGLLITATQAVGAVGRIVAGRISDLWRSRMRPIRVIAVTAAITTGLLALLDYLHSPIAIPVMAVATVAAVADNGLAFTAIAEFAGPGWSGRGLAVQNTAQYLTTAATTPILGAVIGAVGFPVAFALTAIAPLAAVALVPADASRPGRVDDAARR